jgi:hypothetical protein
MIGRSSSARNGGTVIVLGDRLFARRCYWIMCVCGFKVSMHGTTSTRIPFGRPFSYRYHHKSCHITEGFQQVDVNRARRSEVTKSVHGGMVSHSQPDRAFQARMDQIGVDQNLSILAEGQNTGPTLPSVRQTSSPQAAKKPSGGTMKDARAKARALLAQPTGPTAAAPAATNADQQESSA